MTNVCHDLARAQQTRGFGAVGAVSALIGADEKCVLAGISSVAAERFAQSAKPVQVEDRRGIV